MDSNLLIVLLSDDIVRFPNQISSYGNLCLLLFCHRTTYLEKKKKVFLIHTKYKFVFLLQLCKNIKSVQLGYYSFYTFI